MIGRSFPIMQTVIFLPTLSLRQVLMHQLFPAQAVRRHKGPAAA